MSNFQGKGSNPRPYDKDKFNDSFDRIFGRKSEAVATTAEPAIKPGDTELKGEHASADRVGLHGEPSGAKNNGDDESIK